jgi:NOL1/NOP2/fmu family ribosome biogenesis protein
MKQEKPLKDSLKILNTREKKEINQRIKEQWGCELDKSFVFLLSNKNKLYIADKDIGNIDFDKLRVDNAGLYIATVDDKGVRLSIEGSQILGPLAKKNTIEISEEDLNIWFHGKDLEKKEKELEGCKGFIILRRNNDFIGCGKVTEKGILNFVPKTRRILSSD